RSQFSTLTSFCPFFSLFLLTCLRPPISTLFPYTTLFRSVTTFGAFYDSTLDRVGESVLFGGIATYFLRGGVAANRLTPAVLACLDRKSTRLNSSHEWISYAVFCLKKKI